MSKFALLDWNFQVLVIFLVFALIINLNPYVCHINPNPRILTNPWTLKVTLTLGHKPLTLTPDPTLKRRENFFYLIFFLFFFSLIHGFTTSSSFIHVRESNASNPHLFTLGNPMLQTLIYSCQGIQCFKP